MTHQTKTPLQKIGRVSLKKGLLITAGLMALTFTPLKSDAGGFTNFFKKLFAPYGQIKVCKKITKGFENYELKSDHNYFISGPDKECPTAILGLHEDFELYNTKFWRPLNSQKTLQDLIKNMKDKAFDSDSYLDGADVYHNKKDLGDWYSTANRTYVKHMGGNTYSIRAPWKGRRFGGARSKGIGGVTGGGDHSGGNGCGRR